VTFVALYERENWGIIAADMSLRVKLAESGIPAVAWRTIENRAGVSKLCWHPGGWLSFGGVGAAWAFRLLPAIDALPTLAPAALSPTLRAASASAIQEIEATTPQLADIIRDKAQWFVLGAKQAAVLNWRGDDKFGAQLRGRVACCYPPEILPDAAKPFIQDCQAALQDVAAPIEALRPLARLHGEMVKLSGSLKGVSEEHEVGILERAPVRHLHILATDWRLVAAGEVQPRHVTSRAETRHQVRAEPDGAP